MRKLRWVFFSVVILLLSANAQADWEANALLGVSGSYARYDGRYDVGLFYSGFPVLPKIDLQDRQRNTGFGGGLLAGYQVMCNDWLLGIEFSADWFDTDETRVFTFTDVAGFLSWDASLQSTDRGFYALSGRLGYAMAPFFLAYMRLGVEAAYHEAIARIKGAPNVYPFSLELHDKQWQTHLMVGVGAEFPIPLFCELTLRLEYNYHFPTHAQHGQGRILDGIVNPVFSFGAKPAIDTGKISLVWNF